MEGGSASHLATSSLATGSRSALASSNDPPSAADMRLKAALADGTVQHLSCDWLRVQSDGFVVPRCQDAPDGALLSPEEAANAFGTFGRHVGVLSYG